MKTTRTLFTLAAATLLLWATGCEKKDTTVQQDMQKAGADANDAVKKVGEAVKETGEQVAKDVKEASQKVAQDVSTKAQELAAPVSGKAQEIIDATKKYISDGKIQEALAKWKELAGEKLTAEQKAVADSLKAQLDKLTAATSKTADEAAKAAGNLIK